MLVVVKLIFEFSLCEGLQGLILPTGRKCKTVTGLPYNINHLKWFDNFNNLVIINLHIISYVTFH